MPRGIGPGLRPSSTLIAFSWSDDAALEIGDLRLRLRERGLGPRDLQLVADTAPETTREEVERLLERLGRLARDREFAVELEQREVRLRDAGHEREQHAAPNFLGGEQRLLGRFAGAADATPDVDLPGQREGAVEEIMVTRGVFPNGGDSLRPPLPS